MIAEVKTTEFKGILRFLKEAAKQMDLKSGNNVLLSADPSTGMCFEVANRGMYGRITLAADVQQLGTVLISEEHVNKLKLTGKTVKFNLNSPGRLKFSSGRTRGELKVSSDVSVITAQRPTESNFTAHVAVPAQTFSSLVKLVLFTPGVNQSVALRVQVWEGGIQISASDDYRAMRARLTVPQQGRFDVSLPPAFLEKTLPFLAKAGEQIYLMATDRVCRIADDKGTIDIWHPVRLRSGVADIDEFVSGLPQDTARYSYEGTVMIEPADAARAVTAVKAITDKKKEPRMHVELGARTGHFQAEGLVGRCEDAFDITWDGTPGTLKLDMITWHMEEFLSAAKQVFDQVTCQVWNKCVIVVGANDDNAISLLGVLPRFGGAAGVS